MSIKPGLKKKESNADGVIDLEQQFILRLPQGPAEELRKEMQSSSASVLLKDKLGLSIEVDPDMRHGHVRFNNYIFNAKVVDLPCVIESLKSVDKKTFYKTSDICQMMVCTTDEDVVVEDVESPKKKDKDKRYIWNHGITPPMKNVRKKRFRKTLKKKYMDQPELEKEVRRLFRYDAEATDVKWEVLTEDEKPLTEANSGNIETSGTVTNADGVLRSNDASLSMDVASYFGEISSSDSEEGSEEDDKQINVKDIGQAASFFGEVSSSEEEEDKEEDEKDVNIMDSGDEDASRLGESSLQAGESQDVAAEGGDDTADLQEKHQELVQQLEVIREKRLELESQMAEEDNDMMRDRLREDLERFLQEESEKEKEYEILSSMLNQ